MVKKISAYLGGKGGGGKEDMAQGGGLEIKMVEPLKEYIKSLFNS